MQPIISRFQLRYLSIFLICALALMTNQAQAKAMVWKISKNAEHVFIGGSVHMLRASDFPLPTEYITAFTQADSLVFEADVSAATSLAFQQKVIQAMRLPAGQTLKSTLTPKTYNALAKAAQAEGMSITGFSAFKPSFAVLALTTTKLQKIGVSAEAGVEIYFTQKANRSNKAISYLESVEQQLAMLGAMGLGYEDEFIMGSLNDLTTLEQFFPKIIKAWRSADLDFMNKSLVADMQKRFPKLHQSLLADRNATWVPSIEAMFNTPETEFIVVGAAHLVGSGNLLSLLKQKGYKIELLDHK